MTSNFKRAIPVLVEATGLQVFRLMQDTGTARPISIGLHKFVVSVTPMGQRKTVKAALGWLSRSKRYLEATAVEGAMRYGADGIASEPVSESHRAWALGRIKAKESWRTAGRDAQPGGSAGTIVKTSDPGSAPASP